MEPKRKRLMIEVPQELHAQLQDVAYCKHWTQKYVVECALKSYFYKINRKKPDYSA